MPIFKANKELSCFFVFNVKCWAWKTIISQWTTTLPYSAETRCNLESQHKLTVDLILLFALKVCHQSSLNWFHCKSSTSFLCNNQDFIFIFPEVQIFLLLFSFKSDGHQGCCRSPGSLSIVAFQVSSYDVIHWKT